MQRLCALSALYALGFACLRQSAARAQACAWNGQDCVAQLEGLYPNGELDKILAAHRAVLTGCLSWMKDNVGSCDVGALLKWLGPTTSPVDTAHSSMAVRAGNQHRSRARCLSSLFHNVAATRACEHLR